MTDHKYNYTFYSVFNWFKGLPCPRSFLLRILQHVAILHRKGYLMLSAWYLKIAKT